MAMSQTTPKIHCKSHETIYTIDSEDSDFWSKPAFDVCGKMLEEYLVVDEYETIPADRFCFTGNVELLADFANESLQWEDFKLLHASVKNEHEIDFIFDHYDARILDQRKSITRCYQSFFEEE